MAACSCCGSDKKVSDIELTKGKFSLCATCYQELDKKITNICVGKIMQMRRMGLSKKEAIEAVFGSHEADIILATDAEFNKMIYR